MIFIVFYLLYFISKVKAVCTEAGMFALRERRIHVTQEDFEMAVGKVRLWLMGECAFYVCIKSRF